MSITMKFNVRLSHDIFSYDWYFVATYLHLSFTTVKGTVEVTNIHNIKNKNIFSFSIAMWSTRIDSAIGNVSFKIYENVTSLVLQREGKAHTDQT